MACTVVDSTSLALLSYESNLAVAHEFPPKGHHHE